MLYSKARLVALVLFRRVVGDAAMVSVAQAAGLHIAGGDKDFSPTAASLTFTEDWGAAMVLQVSCHAVTGSAILPFLVHLWAHQ